MLSIDFNTFLNGADPPLFDQRASFEVATQFLRGEGMLAIYAPAHDGKYHS
jgi:hypothetical protein